MKLLMICWCASHITPLTVHEHINSFKYLSKHVIDIYNCNDYKINVLNKIPFIAKLKRISLDIYDGIIIHNTISYNSDNVFRLNERFNPSLSEYTGIKILIKQDEMLKVNATKKLLKEWHFDLLLTCVPQKHIDIIYPKSELSKLEKMFTLTGYISDHLRSLTAVSHDDRKFDIVYRAMKLPYNFGRLSYEKYEIGENFKIICQNYKLRYDISSRLEDRVYGKLWYDLLANSIATLAVESGASIYDFDGQVEAKVNQYLKENPKATFEEVYDTILYEYDNKLLYNAISPRHFEAAATRTVQIMYEGEYSGIFIPDRHYIAVKKDYSNIDEVMAKLSDKQFCQRITENAHNEIVCSPKFSYSNFIKEFDQKLDNL